MITYYALVEKETGSAFGVSFPDLPGCYAASDQEIDVFEAAQTALALFSEDDATLTEPRTLADLRRDPSVRKELAAGAFLIAIPLVRNERKARYNVMLDRALVEEVDRAARLSGVSRSDLMATALSSFLADTTGAAVVPRAPKRKSASAV
jgi:predicted RNase H-like HicB family nuclease